VSARRHDLHLRVKLGKTDAFGPGKAALLEGIRQSGSIAQAGRSMKMSYARAWRLVQAMNGEFRAPLVRSAKGGAARGGATLTALGEQVLRRYRSIERRAASAAGADLRVLRGLAR
jgi:molybdate transport system regulatory protein